MDSKELRGLMEAYMDVYAPQEVDYVGEEMRPLPKEKMSRQAQRAYGKEVLAASAGDEKETNRQMQRRIAMQDPRSRRIDLQNKKMGEEVEQIDELDTATIRSAIKKGNKRTDARMDAGDVAGATKSMTNVDRSKRALAKRRNSVAGTPHFPAGSTSYKEELDIFDIVLEFLQAEGYAENLEEAEWMMANVIDEEAIDIILGEGYKESPVKQPGESMKTRQIKASATPAAKRTPAQNKMLRGMGEEYMDEASVANRDPDKYEREQSKKYAPVRGERTPMPPRGNKKREDFEKWYRANVR